MNGHDHIKGNALAMNQHLWYSQDLLKNGNKFCAVPVPLPIIQSVESIEGGTLSIIACIDRPPVLSSIPPLFSVQHPTCHQCGDITHYFPPFLFLFLLCLLKSYVKLYSRILDVMLYPSGYFPASCNR
mmetsp:Transcript_8646/g.21099  ORF Transcript_8646/g.21099 Transcript_8646/m.21099 type:complete len:128 (+) Transcript_8646:200-583(+)